MANLYVIGVYTRTSTEMGNCMNKKSIHDMEVAEVFGYFLDLALLSDKPIKEEEHDDDIQSVE
jgi:hypothetical protein